MLYFFIGFLFVVLIYIDSYKRKIKIYKYVFLTFLFPPLGYGLYRTYRPLINTEIRKGGKKWNLIKWIIIVNTIICIVYFIKWERKYESLGITESSGSEGSEHDWMLAILGLIILYWLFVSISGLFIGLLYKNKSSEVAINNF